MSIVIELAKIAAHTIRVNGNEKQANPATMLARAGTGLSRLGAGAAKLLPKSSRGKAMLGLGAAGGLHLGQDATRSYLTPKPELQRYYDENQLAGKALGQQAARLKAPTDFHETNVGQLLGQDAPNLGVEAPTNVLLRTLARPVHETRMNLSKDPGAYRPKQTNKDLTPLAGGNTKVTNPDGTVTTVGPISQTQHTNRSRLARYNTEMDAAQTNATTQRHRQQAGQAQESGDRQYQRSRNELDAQWRQLGLDPSVVPSSLSSPAEQETPAVDPTQALGQAAAQATSQEMQDRRRRQTQMRDLSRAWNAY